jgi:hypothetical protein
MMRYRRRIMDYPFTLLNITNKSIINKYLFQAKKLNSFLACFSTSNFDPFVGFEKMRNKL